MTSAVKDSSVIDIESDSLPNHTTLLLESGLYREYDLGGDHFFVRRMFNGPDIQFDAHCIYCEKQSTFVQYVGNRGGGAGSPIPKDEYWLESRNILLDFRCQRQKKHAYYYLLRVERQAISKIGQSPSLATIASSGTSRFKKVLAANYLRDLNMAIGLFAHGVGAGSFVYLRRIFEHLLQEAAAAARAAGAPLSGFETMRMDEKIKALTGHLPDEVVDTAGTYSLLSAGIHALPEDRCLALFPVLRASIELILEGHLAAKKRELQRMELKKALASATRQTQTPAGSQSS